jgi:hypothetical protein
MAPAESARKCDQLRHVGHRMDFPALLVAGAQQVAR